MAHLHKLVSLLFVASSILGVSATAEDIDRVDRRHSKKPDKNYRFLAEWPNTQSTQQLQPEQIEEDLDQLEWQVVNRFSYRDLTGVDVEDAFDAVRCGIPKPASQEAFAVQLMRLLALFGDGHTQLEENPSRVLPKGRLPFLLGDAEGGVVAFLEDRSEFFRPEYPYVKAIDGRPIEDWVAAASVLTHGSAQWTRRNAFRTLRYINYVRQLLGEKEKDQLEVTLRAANSKKEKKINQPLGSRKLNFGTWPTNPSRLLEGRIGYLRIPEMVNDRSVLQRMHQRMKEFQNTDGLIIDVRGNTGGSRETLRNLFPYFQKPGSAPYVANIAAYRLRPGSNPSRSEGHLESRRLYPKAWNGWSKEAKKAIDDAAKKFRPEFKLAKNLFSDWHYYVLEPSEDGEIYYYDRPLVILMDENCFSATDIFLGAFQGWNNVTLMGTASGGGSGRVRSVELLHSGFEIHISSMASFRPNGMLYDGNGITPDVEFKPRSTDWIGESDAMLKAALELLPSEG